MPGYENRTGADCRGAEPRCSRCARLRQNPGRISTADLASLDAVLSHAVRRGASDLLLIAGAPVTLRVGGVLSHSTGPPLSAEDTRNLLLPLMTPAQIQELQRNKSVDLCFSREGIGRFRANVHYQRGTIAGSLRLLPEKIPTLESLHLPPALRRLAEARQGLVLVTGPTGCGKSSTLAALVDLINSQRHDHVVTIEDPDRVCALQPQLHHRADRGRPRCAGFRRLPAQHPAAESRCDSGGRDARPGDHRHRSHGRRNRPSGAFDAAHQRHLAGGFPNSRFVSAGNQPQIRQQLSLALLAVVAQQLVPAMVGNGRYPAVEILMASSGVRSLIRKGEDHQLYSALSTGRGEGMISMEQSLAEMVRERPHQPRDRHRALFPSRGFTAVFAGLTEADWQSAAGWQPAPRYFPALKRFSASFQFTTFHQAPM